MTTSSTRALRQLINTPPTNTNRAAVVPSASHLRRGRAATSAWCDWCCAKACRSACNAASTPAGETASDKGAEVAKEAAGTGERAITWAARRMPRTSVGACRSAAHPRMRHSGKVGAAVSLSGDAATCVEIGAEMGSGMGVR